MKDLSSHIPFAQNACQYLSSSPDPYHAVLNSITKLQSSGYVPLSKRQPFTGQILPGGKYYYTVNKTTLVAFCVGEKYKEGNGVKVIGGHTDSPILKVKPRSRRDGSGCRMLNVECYGGGLWHTWFDRDLGVSGRVLVRVKEESSGIEKIEQRFVKIDHPLARVSTLCIHLASAEERKAFQVNKENHLCPIIGMTHIQQQLEQSIEAQLDGNTNTNHHNTDTTKEEELDSWQKEQEPQLLNLIASKLQIQTSQIADFELNLFDTQPASLGGIHSEFIYSARLDNLATCYVSIEALLSHSNNNSLFSQDEDVNMVCLFDHEEVGSTSAQGAGSPIIEEAVKRIITALSGNSGYLNPDVYASAIRKSFVMSVDQAHAIHPNYGEFLIFK